MEIAPTSPFTSTEAAAYFFDRRQHHRGVALLRRSLELEQPGERGVFALLAAHVPADQVFPSVIDDHEVGRNYMRWLLRQSREDRAAEIWHHLLGAGFADVEIAAQYAEHVGRKTGPLAGWRVWNSFVSTSPGSRGRLITLILNGGFEAVPAATRFDWRLRTGRSEAGRTVVFDEEIRRSGTRALRVSFDGSANVTDIGVQQTVYLEPGRYRFGAWVRTENVTTDEGVGFALTAEESPKLFDVATSALRGTNDWTWIEQVFDAPPQGGLVRVRLTRQRSFRLDNQVSGTVWVDDVSITPVP
jgi:hypothetical protein